MLWRAVQVNNIDKIDIREWKASEDEEKASSQLNTEADLTPLFVIPIELNQGTDVHAL